MSRLLLRASLAWLMLASTAMAASFSLDNPGSQALYRSELPLQVYHYSRYADLRDMRIRNAAGELIPYALVAPGQLQAEATTSQLELPVFPLAASTLASPAQLRIALQTSDGTRVDINADQPAAHEAQVFLLDAGENHLPIERLKLAWNGVEGRMLAVALLTSDDLQNWQPAGRATLLKTGNGTARVLQDSMTPDSAVRARYLQLRATDPAQPFALQSVLATLSSQPKTPADLQWQPLQVLQREDDASSTSITFVASGHYPAQSVRVQLPQDNTISSLSLSVRNRSNEPWRLLSKSSVYRMTQQGQALHNPDIELPVTVARYWQLKFDNASGGIGAANPSLQLGWPTQGIVWNARGQAPFTLQVGEADPSQNALQVTSLIPGYTHDKLLQLPQATIQPGVVAAPGVDTWDDGPDWQRWGLWAGLLAGVAILAAMVLALLRAQGKASSQHHADQP